jgi:hypothetical protein
MPRAPFVPKNKNDELREREFRRKGYDTAVAPLTIETAEGDVKVTRKRREKDTKVD